ncbi:hypothetical protein PFISCL1PPCAC_5982, partial [Pristionchus fissidentatus]
MNATTVSMDTILAVFCGCGTRLGEGQRNRPHNLDCGHSMCSGCVQIGLRRVRAQQFTVRCNFNNCNKMTTSKTDSLPLNHSLIALWREMKLKRPIETRVPSSGNTINEKRRMEGIDCAECGEKTREEKSRICLDENCDKFRLPICFVCCVNVHSSHKKGVYKNPESHIIKRGLHKTIDHSPYPDRRVVTVGKEEFVVSASLLSLQSPYFYNLFFGTPESEKINSFTLNCNPIDFSDLLDHFYSKNDTLQNCCDECNSRRSKLFQLASQLEIQSMKEKFEVVTRSYSYMDRLNDNRRLKRLLGVEDERQRINLRFPDARLVHVGTETFLVSTTALSFYSDYFKKLFHSTPIKDQFDFRFEGCDPLTFSLLLEMMEGNQTKTPSVQLLDVLHKLGREKEYSKCFDLINQSIDNLSADEISLVVRDVIEHLWRVRDKLNSIFNIERNKIIKWTSSLSEMDREWMYGEGLRRMEMVRKVKEMRGEMIGEEENDYEEEEEENEDEEVIEEVIEEEMED